MMDSCEDFVTLNSATQTTTMSNFLVSIDMEDIPLPYNTPPISRNLSPEHEVPAEADTDLYYDPFASNIYLNEEDVFINDHYNNVFDTITTAPTTTIDTPIQSDTEAEDSLGRVTLDHPYCTSSTPSHGPSASSFASTSAASVVASTSIISKFTRIVEVSPANRSNYGRGSKTATTSARTFLSATEEEMSEPEDPLRSRMYDSSSSSSGCESDLYSFITSSRGRSSSSSCSPVAGSGRKKSSYSRLSSGTNAFKREVHNEKERQRRIKQKKYAEHLRTVVPEVRKRPKASINRIIDEATIFIKKYLECEAMEERIKSNQMLLDRLISK